MHYRYVVAIAVTACLLPVACRTLPKNPPRTESHAAAGRSDVRLADFARAVATDNGASRSAFMPIDRNDDGLRWRLMLADVAEHTLDLQYFIWHADDTAVLLLDRVIRAADRGVRVRLLVDDLVLMGLDEGAAVLDEHPNIEFRVYNPWTNRDGGWLQRAMEGAFDFDRLNHRMHNKLFVADNHVAILGGRNIGDEYFGIHQAFNFRDFDAIVAGAVVPELSKSFDRYWNSPLAYPGAAIPRRDRRTFEESREEDALQIANAAERLQAFPLLPVDWSVQLDELQGRMTIGSAVVHYDTPREDETIESMEVMDSLAKLAEKATQEVLIASAYLIPTGDVVGNLRTLVERGVRVRIVTNSLTTNDSSMAQKAYSNYRRQMLEAGVELYELRGDAADKTVSDTPPVSSVYLALHSKLIVVDRRVAYIGSLNLDPRSEINTELGLEVTDPEFAAKVASIIERDMSTDNSWTVRLNDRGRIEWVSSLGTRNQSPARNDLQRLGSMFAGMLEGQL